MRLIKLFAILFLGKRLLLAYIDPNSGGMLFQALAIGLGLLSGFLLFFAGKIKILWARIRRRQRESDEDLTDTVNDSAQVQDANPGDQSIEEELG